MDPDPTNPPPATPPADPPGDKTFTQADLDRIVSERLARAKTAPPADYDDLRKQADELKVLKASQLSDQEKLQQRAETAEKAALAAQQRTNDALRKAAVVAAAQRAGAIDPDAVLAMLPSSAVTVGDDGQVTGVDEAVTELLAAKQYLVGKPSTPTPGGADGGPRGKGSGTIQPDDLKNMSPEAIAKAYRAGELSHLVTNP